MLRHRSSSYMQKNYSPKNNSDRKKFFLYVKVKKIIPLYIRERTKQKVLMNNKLEKAKRAKKIKKKGIHAINFSFENVKK